MKNIGKRLLAAMLCVFLLIPLVGCDALDEMRANQAFLQDDGSILWGGNTYKPLPANDYFQPPMSDLNLVLTAKDVPVLLSQINAITYPLVSEDQVLLNNYLGYYCREDQYDAYAQRLTQPFEAEELCFQYGYYDYEKDEYIETFYTLTLEQSAAIGLVLTEVEPWQLDENYNGITGETFYIEESSADHLMRRPFAELVIEGLSIYLLVDIGNGYDVYTVPDALRSIFLSFSEIYYPMYNA